MLTTVISAFLKKDQIVITYANLETICKARRAQNTRLVYVGCMSWLVLLRTGRSMARNQLPPLAPFLANPGDPPVPWYRWFQVIKRTWSQGVRRQIRF